MTDPDQAKRQRSKPSARRWRLIRATLSIASLVIFICVIAAGVRSFFVADGLQVDGGVESVDDGPIRAQIHTYEVGLSRATIGLFRTRDDWDTSEVGRSSDWFHYTNQPRTLITPPMIADRVNITFAGFQIYHGVFLNQASGLLSHDVKELVVPLWPLLLTALPPFLWLRRRRRDHGRGFDVALDRSLDPPLDPPLDRAR